MVQGRERNRAGGYKVDGQSVARLDDNFLTAGKNATAETWYDSRRQQQQAANDLDQIENSASNNSSGRGGSGDSGEGVDALGKAEKNGGNGDNGGSLYSASKMAQAASPLGRVKMAAAALGGGKKSKGPLITLLLILGIGGGVAVTSQSMAPISLVARIKDEFNSMEVSMNKRSNFMLRYQLNRNRRHMVNNFIFSVENFKPTEKQKNQFVKQGIEIDMDNPNSEGYNTFTVTDIDGKKTPGVSFDDLVSNPSTKNKYMSGAATYRGGTAGWFTRVMDKIMGRLGMSRNRWKDFNAGEDDDTRKSKYLETSREKAKDTKDNSGKTQSEEEVEEGEEGKDCGNGRKCKTTTSEGENDAITDRKDTEGNKTKMKTKAVKAASGAADFGNLAGGICAAYSAFEVVQSLVKAQMTMEMLNLATGFLEAVDKTKAGEGSKSPILDYMNTLFEPYTEEDKETGKKTTTTAMQAVGIASLFGVATKDMIGQKSVSAVNSEALVNQVRLGGINLTKTEAEAKKCAYVQIGTGALNAGISLVTGVAGVLTGGIGFLVKAAIDIVVGAVATGILVGVIDLVAEKAASMFAMSFIDEITGIDLGEALASGSHVYLGQGHQGSGGVAGDKEYTKQFKEASADMLAEKAQYERETLSPFDVSSQNTFLGSIVYNMMTLSVGRQDNLTSLMTSMAKLVAKSNTQMLPTANAIDRTSLMLEAEENECPISETVGAVMDMYCNPFEISDMDDELIEADPLDIYQAAANAMKREPLTAYVEDNHFKTECRAHRVYKLIGSEDDSDGICADSKYSFSGQITITCGENEDCPSPPHQGTNKITTSYNKDSDNPEEVDLYYGRCRRSVSRTDDDGTEHTRWFWQYSVPTNFEYAETDYDDDCMLDAKTDSAGNPIINPNSELGAFITLCGARTATLGIAASESASFIVGLDMDKGTRSGGSNPVLGALPVVGDLTSAMEAANEAKYEPWISGRYCVASNDTSINPRWNVALKYYQRYVEDQSWMESAGLIAKSSTVAVLDDYYEKNPLDNSYEGMLARYSGMSKGEVEDTLALIDYIEWLAQYDPSNLGPVKSEVVELGVVEQFVGNVQHIIVDVGRIVGTMREQVVYNERRIYEWSLV